MSEYISAVAASKLTPVSGSTIKRFIREVADDANHSSRDKIQPSVEELKRAQDAGEPYRWTIDLDFAVERFGSADDADNGEAEQPEGLVLDILRTQLDAKDAQIRTLETQLDRKDKQIERQDERMRETHVLMRDLQERLSLTSPSNDAIAEDEAIMVDGKPGNQRRPLFGGLFRRQK